MKRVLFVAGALALTSACGDKVCTMEYYPSVVVTVMDSLTGVHREKGATLVIQYNRDGYVRVDSVRGMVDGALQWGDHVGLLHLTVRQDGYVPWADSVFVQGIGHCQKPRTVGVLARLQRAG